MEIMIQLIIAVVAIILGIIICIVVESPLVVLIVMGVATITMAVTGYIFYKKKEDKLGNLIVYLMRVQDNLSLPSIDSMSEGQLGILESEIYKLVTLLKEKYSGEKKQKAYMVDMLSDISHQIKTPMTAITLMTDLLKAPDLSEEKRLDYVAKIDQQTKRITWLIRNLLTLSQLEADMETFEIIAEVKDIELSLDCPNEVCVTCDRAWTTEAISNIVKNCIEHTPSGGKVTIRVQQNNLATEITIKDTGEGIKKEHLPYIFKRFYKAPGSSNSSVGIGLSMSKQIIMRQNGNISVESEPDAGATFIIKLYK